MKSPRAGKAESDAKEESISFAEFETIMTQIAFRAFGGEPKSSMQSMVLKLFKHIKDPALLSYNVKITLRKNCVTSRTEEQRWPQAAKNRYFHAKFRKSYPCR